MSTNRLMLVTIAVVALAGLGVSSYLTSVHYASTPLVCSANGVIDCHRVLTSSYSEVLGLPWSAGGIVWFAFSGGLAVFGLSKRDEPGWLQPAQLGWSVLGLTVVAYLVGVEALALKTICLWCSAMHVLIVLTFLLTVLRTPGEVQDGKELTGSTRSATA